MTQNHQQRAGVAYGAAAFLWWGFAPFYFKAVGAAAPQEVLAHRIIWSCLFLLGLLAVRGRFGEFRRLLVDRRTLGILSITTFLIAGNWLLFIWAIANQRLLEASLGYFINPLVNVLLGFVVFRERLTRLQTGAVALAAAGVAWLALGGVGVPLISLALAFSFSIYGMLRKRTPVSGTVGLTAETMLLWPWAVAWLILRQARGELAFGNEGPVLTIMLVSAGWITALPLIWFAEGARRIRYATLGFLQYLAPTFQFLVAVLAFGEPFTPKHAVSFGCIWIALGLYSLETIRQVRSRKPDVAD
ncbi:MAG: EamA family transporter RarD [Candidatus Krumholzibacteriia bacterium]